MYQGGIKSAVYGSITGMNTYFSSDLTGTYANYSSTQKTNALIEATRLIDRLPFRGEKYQLAPTQELQFPRIVRATHLLYLDYDLTLGTVIVPPDVIQSAYMQAKFLLDMHIGKDSKGKALLSGLTSLSVGGTSESYSTDKALASVDPATNIVREAHRLLEKYMLVGW